MKQIQNAWAFRLKRTEKSDENKARQTRHTRFKCPNRLFQLGKLAPFGNLPRG